MTPRSASWAWCAAGLFAAGPAMPQDTIIQRGLKWSEVITDDAAGSVSASAMLDLDGDAIRTVENVRDLVVSLKGLEASGTKGTLGISITPARTSLLPMDLATYAAEGAWAQRLLGTTTLSYAQGDRTIDDVRFERRAVSIETSLYLKREDDPQVALALAYKSGKCKVLVPAQPMGPPRPAPLAPATPTAAAPGANDDGPQVPREATPAETEAVKARAKECRDRVTKALGWNRSRVSASIATGWIKSTAGAQEQNRLGRMAAVGGLFGLGDSAAISAVLRRSEKEPIIETLVNGPVQFRSRTLVMLRLAGGSSNLRALIEGSNARDTEVTASQRTFKQALGLDIKAADALWINLRLGRLSKIAGNGQTETGSSVMISYSPTALLPGN